MTRTKANTELIVIVTPEIVSPVPAGTSIPNLSFPEKVLPGNSNVPMHTPDAKTADSVSWQAPATIPVEQLIESMKPGPQLTDSSGSSTPSPASAASTSTQP
jgi:pilus assembly protein CpaC